MSSVVYGVNVLYFCSIWDVDTPHPIRFVSSSFVRFHSSCDVACIRLIIRCVIGYWWGEISIILVMRCRRRRRSCSIISSMKKTHSIAAGIAELAGTHNGYFFVGLI